MNKQIHTTLTNTPSIKTGVEVLAKEDIYTGTLSKIGCICLLGSLVACDPVLEETANHDWIVADEQEAVVPADFVNPVIAEIDAELAGKIEFLDESLVGGIGIGVVAIGAEGGRAIALLDAEAASPLEVFLALAPADAAPPEALLVDHQELARAGEVDWEPRALLSLRGGTYVDDFCDGPPSDSAAFNNFWSSWSSGYGATNKTATVAATNFNITTGNSSKRALAACSDNGTTDTAVMVIQRERPSSLLWDTLYTKDVEDGLGVAYHSSYVAESTRYREIVFGNDPNRYWAAASW